MPLVQPNGKTSHAPRPGPVLADHEHPDWWPLEDLLLAIIADLEAKNARVEGDTRTVVQRAVGNNKAIISLLRSAHGLQMNTLRSCDVMGLS